MAGKIVTSKSATISAVTSTGYVTIASTTGWYASAKGALATMAVGILTATGNFVDGDIVTIGLRDYTFQTVLTNVNGHVLLEATASGSLDNLIAAIGLGAGAGVKYAAATTANADVTAAAGAGDTMDVTSRLLGVFGNLTPTTVTLAGATASWGAATLTGAVNKLLVITEVASATSLGVRIVTEDPYGFTSGIGNAGPNYGRSDMSAYNGGTIYQHEQFIYNPNDAPLT